MDADTILCSACIHIGLHCNPLCNTTHCTTLHLTLLTEWMQQRGDSYNCYYKRFENAQSTLDICLMHCVSFKFKGAQFGLLPHFHLALSRLHTQSRVTTLMCVSCSTYVSHTCIHSHFLIYQTFMSKQDKLIHANTHTCTNTHAMTKQIQSQLVAPDAHSRKRTTCRENSSSDMY